MSKSLLVVDDSPAIHKVIRIALSRHDFEVVPASSVAEANIELRRKQFSLILVDSGISDELRAFEAIKSACRQVPVLILMSGLDKLSEEDLRSIGINIFLKKPFEAKEILSTVQKILGIQSEPVHTPVMANEPVKSANLPPIPPLTTSQQLPPLPIGEGTRSPAPPKQDIAPPSPPSASVGDWTMAHIAPDFRRVSSEDLQPNQKFPAVFSDFDAISGSEDPAIMTAKLPLQDNAKRGKKAFGDHESAAGTSQRPPPAASQPNIDKREAFRSEDNHVFGHEAPTLPMNLSMTSAEVTEVIKHAVAEYCRSHFEELAREIITSELRRLAEEKSRHLLDG